MTPVRAHNTEVDTDRAWDAAEAVRNTRSGEDAAYYGRIFAWRDPDADPATKAAWKFPHHFVSAEGDPGAASARGCQSGIGVLNGAMGGADIPSGDRRGVYNHLAAHLRAAEIEPADLRSLPTINPLGVERRALATAEIRIAGGEEGPPRIEGYAALFNVWSEDLGGFRELIEPGAFTKTIQEADVRGLQNHDPNKVLGRTKAGTLALNEDDRGLAFVLEPPNAGWARDLLASMERGDVDQCSFGFETVRDRWAIEDDQFEQVRRRLLEVRLYDISIVTFPAYSETTAEVRAIVKDLQTDRPGRGAHGSGQTAEGSRGRLARAVCQLELARRRSTTL